MANESAIEVGQGDSLAHFEVFCNKIGNAWDLLRLDGLRVQNVTEQKLTADEGGDLDLDWAGDFRRNILGHYVGDQAFDLLSVSDGVKREQVLDRLIQAICLHVLAPPRQLDHSSALFGGLAEDFSLDLITRLKCLEITIFRCRFDRVQATNYGHFAT